MIESKATVRVPDPFRDSLHPYTELFENIIVPMITQASWGMIDNDLGKNLRMEIAEYENRNGQHLHYLLTYYGLMFCCLHTSQDILATNKDARKNDRRTKQINLVNKARLLICLAYQQDQFMTLPLMF
jgi:hypothetical protein